MEEEVGIKVTRLRRRLSVEAEDVKSPSTQSTPTKKRGGRLAAKPQLELIDENATDTEKPKRTKKTAAKDVEPEEKPITPARRSARTRSNTSLVSETPVEAEEKGTPSRRSTRIKSNTSIVAETVQFTDSPRAKRAARRTSQIGSDNEAPITPARQTRRTRKDSSSSIDKPVDTNAGKLVTQIKEAIAEEVENKNKETITKDSESPSTRKSPRLTGRKSSLLASDNKENEPQVVKESSNDKSDTVDGAVISSPTVVENKTEVTEENNLSVSSSNLIKDIDSEPKKGKPNLNKTTSAADLPQAKSKRHRTKSWTTITSSPSSDSNFLSDTEATNKKNKRKSGNLLNLSASGDNALNTSNKITLDINDKEDIKEESLNASTASDKKKKKRHSKSMTLDNNADIEEVSAVNTSTKLNKSTVEAAIDEDTIMNTSTKQDKSKTELNKSSNKLSKDDPNFTEKFFSEAPSGVVQSSIYIEDSDSNTDSLKKVNINKELDSEDQCVPVVEHQLDEENNKESKNNLSYEPMDIDETMPENISLSNFTDKNVSRQEKDAGIEKRKSSLNISQVNNVSIVNNANKSFRKSLTLDPTADTDVSLNKSKRQSLSVPTSNDSINKGTNKSKSNSSFTAIDIDDKSNQSQNQSTIEENMNKNQNKSKRTSSIANTVTDNGNIDNNTSTTNTETEDGLNKSSNKSKRKSSILNIVNDDNNIHMNSSTADTANDSVKSTNKSTRKSSISHIDVDSTSVNTSNIITEYNIDSTTSKPSNDLNKSSNKSKRKSSITNVDINDSVTKDVDKSKRKSVPVVANTNEVDGSSNKSKRKSSIGKLNDDIIDSCTETDEKSSTPNQNDSINKSKRKSVTAVEDNATIDDIVEKSKRKSSISNADANDNMDNSTNKSKRKSSVSQIKSQSFDKSNNENKSTLVLSQLKDISESNAPKDIHEFNESNDFNEQLSKSANVASIIKDKESDKKNLSLTYSTSTPLQQKSVKKLGMQINTSIIAPNSVTKKDKKHALNTSKKETSVLSQNDEESEPDEDEEEDSEEDDDDDVEEEEDSEEENDSSRKSKMIDDEAEEASDDYESGDSRNDEEKEYEEQNEIVEKGETLDSEEEDFSDDSDYERDSFIVDSDEEDNELLSGSGDDLSMSDNELNMSAKSKKKFNARKQKEQKKASREMFEARHKFIESDRSAKSDKPKPKKINRQRLESSDSESDEDISMQPKKNRRARIDSSQDVSQPQSDADKSVSNKKKKVKRLSESVCEDVASNEKEISIQQNNDSAKADPLSLQNIVKEEPKTPQKDLNISTVAITNIEEVEEVHIDENVSIMKMNQTSDPLQAAVAQDDEMEDDSDESISENEEITQNYESVLNDLNNKSKKVKSLDISLNLNKRTKQKNKDPIVDQLNLTQVKKSKKKKDDAVENSEPQQLDKDKSLTNKIIEKVNKSINIQDEGSSDSIDMKLLFNEDSTDGEINVATEKDKDNTKVVEDFIPLKRTEGKTNILASTDVTSTTKDDSSLNVSKSKKNKRMSSQPEETAIMSTEDVQFFIDTTGTHTDADNGLANTSVKDSAKKKKQKNLNVSSVNNEDDDDSNDAPLEISYKSEKNNKSVDKLNSTQIDDTTKEDTSQTPSQSGKKKKKNKKSVNNSQINVEDKDNTAEKSINTSIPSITESNKKKNKLSESHQEENIEQTKVEPGHNVSVGSAKKQKKKRVSESYTVEKENITEDNTSANEENLSMKRKRKPSANDDTVKEDNNLLNISTLNESIVTNKNKKRKITHTDEADSSQTDAASVAPDVQQSSHQKDDSTPKKSKKKNKSMEEQNPIENIDERTNKNKKRKVRTDDDGGERDKLSKVIKQNSSDKAYVPRLPASVLKQLDDLPKKDIKTKVTSTTSFKVEETKKRRNKPSNYLEQSVYLNDSIEEETKKSLLKKPKVLPFIPTASTSSYGFTTNFRVNVIAQETQFIAQASDVTNFKKDYLQKNRVKKLGIFEMYKRQRNIKISKF